MTIFTAIIATRGNAIIAAILQWNTFHNKRMRHHPTCVPLVKIVQTSSDNTYFKYAISLAIFGDIVRYIIAYAILLKSLRY